MYINSDLSLVVALQQNWDSPQRKTGISSDDLTNLRAISNQLEETGQTQLQRNASFVWVLDSNL